jgi:hypothetical protein
MIGEETEAMPVPEMSSSPIRGRMGTGLRWAELAMLIVVSTVLFLVWPTLLWKTTRDASHVSRFAVSYLAVIPLAAAILAFRWRRVPLRELSAAVLIVWSVKMLITVGLYDGFVTRGRTKYEPPAAPDHFVHAQKHAYTPVPGFRGRTVEGKAEIAGGGVAHGAWIYAPALHEGLPVSPSAKREVTNVVVRNDRIEPSLLVVPMGTSIHFQNAAGATVVLSGQQNGRTVYNAPVVPGGDGRSVRLDKPGRVRFSARVGPSEGVFIVQVVDNPYIARARDDGTFSIENLPPGNVELIALAPHGPSEILESRVKVENAAPVSFELAPAPANPADGGDPRELPGGGS